MVSSAVQLANTYAAMYVTFGNEIERNAVQPAKHDWLMLLTFVTSTYSNAVQLLKANVPSADIFVMVTDFNVEEAPVADAPKVKVQDPLALGALKTSIFGQDENTVPMVLYNPGIFIRLSSGHDTAIKEIPLNDPPI